MKPFLITFMTVLSILNSSAQMFRFPVFDNTDTPEFHLDSIECFPDSTILFLSYHAEKGSWANISSQTYIDNNGKHYSIVRSEGLPFAPEKRVFNYESVNRIKFVFPHINLSSPISLIESTKDKAFNIYRINLTLNNPKKYIETDYNRYKYMAEYYKVSGNNSVYIEYSEKELEAAKFLFGINSITCAKILDNLSWAYGLELNYETAIHQQMLAANIYFNNKDWISLAETHNRISHYYHNSENLDDAERNIKKAISILNKHDNPEQYLKEEIIRRGISMINTQTALVAIEERINVDKASFYQTLARIYQKQGNYKEAITSELKCGKVLKSIHDDEWFSIHLMTLSQYYMINNQLNDAKACIEDYLKMPSADKPISIALTKLQLAHIYSLSKDSLNSFRYAKESVAAAKLSNNNEEIIEAEAFLSQLYYQNSNYNEAELCMANALEKMKDNIHNQNYHMTSEQKQRLWDKYEQHFLLYRDIVDKSNRAPTLMEKLYNNVLFSKNLLLKTEYDDKTDRLINTWKNIQQQLSDNDIAIEFIATNGVEGNFHIYHALVIDKSCSSPKMITLYSEKELEKVKKTNTKKIEDIVGELIWNPILSHYKNVKNIYFSPDGILHILPIEYFNKDCSTNMFEHYNMFRVSSTKELIREQNVQQKISAVLYGGLDYNPYNRASVIGGTDNSSSVWRDIAKRGGFDPLLNTVLEIKQIYELINDHSIQATIYTGENGTEESFRNLSSKNDNIIHLATHGMYVRPDDIKRKINENNYYFLDLIEYDNNPVKEDKALTHSFLVMSGGNGVIERNPFSDITNDGILTAKEISQLDLNEVDLVVLSACESALGDIYYDGVYGLQRGFKKAGANTIIMSLDKVDDEATRILMVEFYKNLMSGKTKLQSLKDAQLHLRTTENGKFSDPKYWAAFIMLDGLN